MMKRDNEDYLLKKAEEIVLRHFTRGIHQDNLIKELGVDRKKGEKVVSMLIKKGVIKRRVETVSSKKVIYLYPKDDSLHAIPVSLNLLSQIPCFWCRNLLRCRTGSNPDPANCTILEEWLIRRE